MTYKIPNAQILNGISQIFFQISRPVHVIFKSDKLDYFRSPSQQKIFFHFFSFKTASSSPGKWNWHLLSFLPFIFIFPQCAMLQLVLSEKNTRSGFYLATARFGPDYITFSRKGLAAHRGLQRTLKIKKIPAS